MDRADPKNRSVAAPVSRAPASAPLQTASGLPNQRRQRRLLKVERPKEIIRLSVLRGGVEVRERVLRSEDLLNEPWNRGLLADLVKDEPRLGEGRDDDQRQPKAQAVRVP